MTGNAGITSRQGSVGGQPGEGNGQSNNALTVDTDGVITINAGQNVNIGTSEDLDINRINAGNDVTLTGHGDITGVGGDPTITGRSATLDAISTGDATSTIGNSSGGAMTTNTSELGIRGDNATINNTGNVVLDDIVGSNVNIQTDGSVTQKEGTQADVSDLEIRAGGNIAIVTHVDEITAIGENVYLDNKSDDMIVREIMANDVTIYTAGNMNTSPDGMITAHNLKIRAVYNVGTSDSPLRITVDGIVDVSSIRGNVYLVNFFRPAQPVNVSLDEIPEEIPDGWRMLEDRISKIRVYGMFAPSAVLKVLATTHYAMLTDPALQEQFGCGEDLETYSRNCTAAAKPEIYQALIDSTQSDVCKMLWALVRDQKSLYDFVLGIFSNDDYVCKSTMYFEVTLDGLDSNYDGHLEGETLYVLLCVANELVCIPAQVQEGKIQFKLDRLGMNNADYGYTPFVIVEEDVFHSLLAEKASGN